ncbi:conserved hypothetical protein [Burkholderia pseudomallei 1710a]|uniref:Uncharacterized protein n=1 Tax=Burkholderia pseudomallei 1710a TaxID=320371 RepID=A0A0E1VU02_BURPE|nr:conserved hypothetical protein [Burkholderia pseudomallei 1710a]
MHTAGAGAACDRRPRARRLMRASRISQAPHRLPKKLTIGPAGRQPDRARARRSTVAGRSGMAQEAGRSSARRRMCRMRGDAARTSD